MQLEPRELLQREFDYWSNPPTDRPVDPGIEIGALGAISNVIAALHGFPAPWHRLAPDPSQSNQVWPVEIRTYGTSWVGLIRMRVLYPAGNWRTIWMLSLARHWMFGVAFPAWIYRILRLEGRR